MANSPAPALILGDDDRLELQRWVRSTSARAGLVQRARIILLAAEGVANYRIAEQVGVSMPTVLKWRQRFQSDGLSGLADQRRSGRPRTVDRAKVLTHTLKGPAKSTGRTHWSSRAMGKKLGIGNATVARIWREQGLQPWRSESFRFSTDPELEAKVIDVIGLYLNPPENAIVLSVDEKSRVSNGLCKWPILEGAIDYGSDQG